MLLSLIMYLCLCALAGLFLFETHYIFNQMTIVLILYNVLLFCALTYLSLFVLSPWYAVVADYVFMSVCFGWSIFIWDTLYFLNQMTIVLILCNALLFCALTYLSLFVLSPWYAVVADYVCFYCSCFIYNLLLLCYVVVCLWYIHNYSYSIHCTAFSV